MRVAALPMLVALAAACSAAPEPPTEQEQSKREEQATALHVRQLQRLESQWRQAEPDAFEAAEGDLRELEATLPKSASSGRPVAPVPFLPFGNLAEWMLTEALTYTVLNSTDSVVVPRGFVSDFAGIPPYLQSLIQRNGPHGFPAVVHDYLYWEQGEGCTRRQADRIFFQSMAEHGVSRVERRAMFLAVVLFGAEAYAKSAADRAARLPRVVPIGTVRPPNAGETWPRYREYLRGMAVAPGPPVPIEPAFCRHGGEP